MGWVLILLLAGSLATVIFVFGMTFDLKAEASADDWIVDEATSECLIDSGPDPYYDVGLASLLDRVLSEGEAFRLNEEYAQPYGKDAPEVFPENMEESYRFLIGSLVTWIFGVFVISAILQYNARETQESKLERYSDKKTRYEDLSVADKTFLIILNPVRLLDLYHDLQRFQAKSVMHGQHAKSGKSGK